MGWLFPEHLIVAFMVFLVSSMVISKQVRFTLLKNVKVKGGYTTLYFYAQVICCLVAPAKSG